MANEAKESVDRGFNVLKIKTDRELKNDVKAIRLIRKNVGDNVRLKIDANQGWNIHDTLTAGASLIAAQFLRIRMAASDCFYPFFKRLGKRDSKRRKESVKKV
jgi:hypothetical protein